MKEIVAIYARISSEKNEKDVSIDQQIEQGKAFAKSKGMGYETYIDEGYSGTLEADERPAMLQLLQDIIPKDSKIKILWGREHFRLYRGTEPKRQIQVVCKKHEVDIYYADQKLDRTDPNVELMDDILGVLGKFYVNLTIQNVKQTIGKNFRDGKAHGVAPYGYKTGEGKILEIDPDQAKEVRNMFNWHIEGLGVTSIAKRLTDLEVPTQYDPSTKHTRFSKEWDRTTIYGILKNRLYHGIRTHNDWDMTETKRKLISTREIPAPQLAIIDEDIYNESQLSFERNKSYTGKRTFYKYLLNDLIICGHCKDRYLGRSDNKSITVYKCNGKRKDNKTCQNRAIRKTNIEQFVWDYITSGDVLIKNLMEASKNGDIEVKREELINEIALFEKVDENLTKEYNTSRLSHRKGLYTDEELAADKKEIDKNRLENSAKLRNLKEQLGNLQDEETIKEELLRQLDKLVDSPDFEDDSPLLVHKQQMEGVRQDVLDNNYGHIEKQEFLNKFIDDITIDFTGGIFKILINYKSPLTNQTLYMDRKYYAAIEEGSKKVFDLGNEKQHNLLKELKALTRDVVRMQGAS